MSCQVYTKKKNGELEEIWSNHNGLLRGLAALCYTKEEHGSWKGNNDIILTEEQLVRGVKNILLELQMLRKDESGKHVYGYKGESNCNDGVFSLLNEDNRFDHLVQAAYVLVLAEGKKAKELILG
jgi:hypothetical protein